MKNTYQISSAESICAFEASSSNQKRRLTPDELARYEEQGFVEVAGVFSSQELEAINSEIELLRQKAAPRPNSDNPLQDSHFLFGLGLRSELTRRLCEDERILTLLEDIVFPGIAIHSAKLVEKLPLDDTVCHWHQDEAYYKTASSQSQCRMSVWIPLQDCDQKNGCIWVVPGSHKLGLLQHQPRKDGICKIHTFQDGSEDIPNAIPYPIKAGSILLFHALTSHRSLGNSTTQPRRSFIISYQDALAGRYLNGNEHKILRPAA